MTKRHYLNFDETV